MNTKTSLFDWYILEANKYFAYFGWGTSSIFSFIGVMEVAHLPWFMYIIAAVFAVGVNVVEAGMGRLSFQELRHPKDLNGIVTLCFGLVCYAYDIWTNVAGFCFMFTGTASVALAWNVDKSLLVWPVLLGVLFAIGPEPLYRFYLTHAFQKPKSHKQLTQSQSPWNPPIYEQKTTDKSKDNVRAYLQKKYPNQFK